MRTATLEEDRHPIYGHLGERKYLGEHETWIRHSGTFSTDLCSWAEFTAYCSCRWMERSGPMSYAGRRELPGPEHYIREAQSRANQHITNVALGRC